MTRFQFNSIFINQNIVSTSQLIHRQGFDIENKQKIQMHLSNWFST